MLAALNAISTAQSNATTTTMGDIVCLLHYVATHPNATIHYHASDMIFHISSNASYLCQNGHVADPEAVFPSPTD